MSTETSPQLTPALTPVRVLRLQKATCGCGKPIVDGGECAECAKKRLQRKGNGSAPSMLPSSVQRVLNSPGQPLPTATRTDMEQRFGQDFSRVRIHTDAIAAQSAHDVNAHAYTVGQDIAFAPGRYDANSSGGRELLAHELAHTVQQRGLQRSSSVAMDEGAEYQQLEREAESAARTALSGGTPSLRPAADTRLSRAAATPSNATSQANLKAIGVEEEDALALPGADKTTRRFLVKNPFPLPGEKGNVFDLWDKRAKGGGLEAIMDTSDVPEAALKQARPGPEEMRRIWLGKVGWSEANAASNWGIAGGIKRACFDPPQVDQGGPKTCFMDHIVELQVGGNNVPENLQVLGNSPNSSSGAQIMHTLRAMTKAVREADPSVRGSQIGLRWNTVTQKSPVITTDRCLRVEAAALAGPNAASANPQIVVTPNNNEGLPISDRGSDALVQVTEAENKAKKKDIPISESPLQANKAAATIIPGVRLNTLVRGSVKQGHDLIHASIDTDAAKLPMTMKAVATKQLHYQRAHGAKGTLTIAKASPKIPFDYKHLSPGYITSVAANEQGGITWEGKITPKLTFLGELDVKYDGTTLRVQKGLEKVKPLFPGVVVKEASLVMELGPAFKPSGNLVIELSAAGKPIGSGTIIASANENGLTLNGTLTLIIPGVDEAKMDVAYANGLWTGEGKIESTKIKMPYVKSATLRSYLDAKGVSLAGQVVSELPGGNVVTLDAAKDKAGKWVFTGSGKLNVPKLEETTVLVSFDGETLIATGATKFSLFAIKGDLTSLTYKAKKGEEGKLSGKGTLNVKKGKAAGVVNVKLLESGRFAGDGTLTYQLTPALLAKVAVEIDEKEKLRLTGALTFAEIKLFEATTGTRNLFKVDKNIPIPGASIGPVGLAAKLGGAVDIGYGIGPGVLKNVGIEAQFNPLEDNPNVSARMTSRLEVPAYAGITGTVTGGIAVDAGIAEIAGGLTLAASLTLKGGIAANVEGQYAKQRFEVKASAEVFAALILGLGLSAFASAKAGVGAFSVEKRKDWTLKKLSVPTGVDFKLSAPIHYASDQPFKPPSVNDITWSAPPKIDPGDLLKRIFAAATTKETKA